MSAAQPAGGIAPARIAGLAGPEASEAVVGRMLEHSLAGRVEAAGAPPAPTIESAPGGVLGWIGEGPAKTYAHDRFACALDGAIYNHPELRAGEGESEAATLCRLWAEHGPEGALALLNGDFAIAVHDRAEDALWLARDRFGIRPLYFVHDGRRLGFASRLRALLGAGLADKQLNPTYVALMAACHYRYFDNDPWASPFAGIAQLPAAYALRFRDGSTDSVRWWALEETPDLDAGPDELAEEYRRLLVDAVALRSRAASRQAFTLSGGMDSSSVLASAVVVSGERQHAFSTLYAGSEYDESEEIRSMLDSAVSEWHRVAVDDPDVLGNVERMIEAHDEPVATATWLSHYVLCGVAAGEGFGTLFGGLGGDELNAGEYEYFIYRFADLRAAGREDELAAEVERWVAYHDHPVFRKDTAVMEEALARLTDPAEPGRIVPDGRRIERYAAALDPRFFDLRAYEPEMDHPFTSYLKNRTFQDIFRETAPCCLRAEDRQTAAFGMRNADPFFDHRLAELMFRVPGELKIRDGVTKRLLREAMRGVLVEETRTRIAKTGWNAPADAWFSGEGSKVLRELTASESFRGRGIYDLAEVERLIGEHDEIVRSGRPAENHMMFLWQLVNLELWLRWVDRL